MTGKFRVVIYNRHWWNKFLSLTLPNRRRTSRKAKSFSRDHSQSMATISGLALATPCQGSTHTNPPSGVQLTISSLLLLLLLLLSSSFGTNVGNGYPISAISSTINVALSRKTQFVVIAEFCLCRYPFVIRKFIFLLLFFLFYVCFIILLRQPILSCLSFFSLPLSSFHGSPSTIV